MNKAQSQRVHAKRRLDERYGMEINRHQIRDLVAQIQSGKAEHVETQTNRLSIKTVCFNGVKIPVAYDKQRKTIVTFFPKNSRYAAVP